MGEARRYSARELERMALHYAIEEREGFLSSLGSDPADKKAADRARSLVFGWKAMVARRYGSEPVRELGAPVCIFALAPPQAIETADQPAESEDGHG